MLKEAGRKECSSFRDAQPGLMHVLYFDIEPVRAHRFPLWTSFSAPKIWFRTPLGTIHPHGSSRMAKHYHIFDAGEFRNCSCCFLSSKAIFLNWEPRGTKQADFYKACTVCYSSGTPKPQLTAPRGGFRKQTILGKQLHLLAAYSYLLPMFQWMNALRFLQI